MNWTLVIYGGLVAWCISATGCTLCQNAMRTVWHEPAAYSWKHDRRRSVESYHQWADAALAEEQGRCPDLFAEPDYVMGFRDGFVDYVYLGGTGEPPPVPPRQFWNVMLRSPDGKQRANLWFDGYRHGAAVARDGGYRDWGRVHSSLMGYASGPYDSEYVSSIHGTEAYGANEPLPDGEMLPEAPNAAPALTPPVDNGETNSQEPASAFPSPDAPLDAPGFTEPPFGDDPELPESENDDQPLSMHSPAVEQHAAPLHDTVGGETRREGADVDMFDVQPAVLLNAIDENVQGHEAVVTKKSPASTMRFVDESPMEGEQAKIVDASSADRRVIRNSFRGWSRRVTTESTLNYRTPQAQEQ